MRSFTGQTLVMRTSSTLILGGKALWDKLKELSRGWKVIHYDWLARTKNSEEPERLDPFNFDLFSADKECWAREVYCGFA